MSYVIASVLFIAALISAGVFYHLFFVGKLYHVDMKHLLYFGLFSSLFFLLISPLSLLYIDHKSVIYLATIFLMLIAGIIFLLLIGHWKIIPAERPWWVLLLAGFVFSFGGFLFVIASELIISEVKHYDNFFRNAQFFAFLLPTFAYLAIYSWRSIPKLIPSGWNYDPYYLAPPMLDGPDVVWLKCVFRVEHIDYPMLVPSKYRLGDAFHRTIQDSKLGNSAIRTQRQDEQGNPISIAWNFVIEEKESHRRRMGEPALTMEKNRITDGDIIWLQPISA